jgi:two-component system, LytTR family, response regulator
MDCLSGQRTPANSQRPSTMDHGQLPPVKLPTVNRQLPLANYPLSIINYPFYKHLSPCKLLFCTFENVIKALIIDDEPSAINTLRLMLERYVPEISELRHTNNPDEGLALIPIFQPNILFLDIQMPTMSGFDLLRRIQPVNFNIIFTTAHDQYAVEAIRFSALDYLLKPIDADELRAAVDKHMIKEVVNRSRGLLYNNLLHNINSTDKKDFKLAVNTTSGTFFFQPSEIIRLEAESNYTQLFFTNKKKLLTSRTLKDYDEILSSHGFIRIHKSHLVNRQHVVNYMGEGMLTMADNSKVEISRRRQHEVMRLLKGS